MDTWCCLVASCYEAITPPSCTLQRIRRAARTLAIAYLLPVRATQPVRERGRSDGRYIQSINW